MNRPAASRLLYSGASKDADFTENKMNRVQTGCSYIQTHQGRIEVMNDKELVSRMQHGDMQAFDELYERYKDDAYRLAC